MALGRGGRRRGAGRKPSKLVVRAGDTLVLVLDDQAQTVRVVAVDGGRLVVSL